MIQVEHLRQALAEILHQVSLESTHVPRICPYYRRNKLTRRLPCSCRIGVFTSRTRQDLVFAVTVLNRKCTNMNR